MEAAKNHDFRLMNLRVDEIKELEYTDLPISLNFN
jgi:hypothetical protein